MIRALMLAVLAALTLTGCGTNNPPPADPAEVARAAYVHSGPPQLTLLTVRTVAGDSGAHTALMVNGSQRVLWDPAGSFRHPNVPEVADLHYGITPNIERGYIDYHVREDHYVVRQDLAVDAATANRLISAMRNHGAAPQATCARSTSTLLRQAGIDVGTTWYPNALMNDFGQVPGVSTQRIDNSNVDRRHNIVFGKDGVPLPPT
ncbi:hypothetical protein PARPLA_00605 [Rhodobacteraceae bacterium THAF1]|uniref:hypothetical protein n=1 Tax=Palleronia sp. THAF1 TaxID=2587842 RepID=UPI000F3F435C|nr:hypothetical protein [Palleronia sp. THAF1]QFU09832.1 hypothetical protein FIU81_14235 [Palleronia sp. THAF1]VDC17265.1 hypothetical protein PARPLA_00605 [Rhodobacteraceae bacterium THAF1]